MKLLSKTITETDDAGVVVSERAGVRLSVARGDVRIVVTASGDGHTEAIDKLRPVCKAIEDGNQLSLIDQPQEVRPCAVFERVTLTPPSGVGGKGSLGFTFSDMTAEKRALLTDMYENQAKVMVIIQRMA